MNALQVTGVEKVVVIVGGGFAGLSAAKAFAKTPKVHVILVDQRNYHLFQPLLYQVATAGLNPSDIAVPIRAQFSESDNVEVHLGKAHAVNLKEKTIRIDNIDLRFDYLILACGAQHSYFGHPEWEDFAPGLKTLEQATEIRRRILLAFEKAENELDLEKQKNLLTFAVVGGGPTGVELAGAIADISRTVLVRDFKRIDPSQSRVLLIEAGPRILSSFTEKLSQRAQQDLHQMGVEIRCQSRVEKIDADGIQIGTEHVPAKTVFWAAGVQASRIQFSESIELDRAGRVKVNNDFSVPGFPEIFVVGDMCSKEIEAGKILPGLAPVAKQSGQYVAQVIKKRIEHVPTSSFRYLDKGQMATIGKKRAIAQFKSFQIAGVLAWLAWLFIHVFYLVGFKNRISVMSEWVWSYIFSKRSSRLITERNWKLESQPPSA